MTNVRNRFFEIWTIGIYLGFGAWSLVLHPYFQSLSSWISNLTPTPVPPLGI